MTTGGISSFLGPSPWLCSIVCRGVAKLAFFPLPPSFLSTWSHLTSEHWYPTAGETISNCLCPKLKNQVEENGLALRQEVKLRDLSRAVLLPGFSEQLISTESHFPLLGHGCCRREWKTMFIKTCVVRNVNAPQAATPECSHVDF